MAWEILFPPACAACGRVQEVESCFCADCELRVERLPAKRCPRCGEPGPFGDAPCGRCQARPPAFDFAVAPFLHDGPVSRAIHRFKYEDHPELASPLAGLLAASASFLGPQTPVVALPLHRRRFLERAYDQAELLVRALCRRTGARHLPGALLRTRYTRRQVGLSEPERERNVRGAFLATRALTGQTVVLVDDVFTTGATARAAAAALKQAGASRVQVLTLARAFSP